MFYVSVKLCLFTMIKKKVECMFSLFSMVRNNNKYYVRCVIVLLPLICTNPTNTMSHICKWKCEGYVER